MMVNVAVSKTIIEGFDIGRSFGTEIRFTVECDVLDVSKMVQCATNKGYRVTGVWSRDVDPEPPF